MRLENYLNELFDTKVQTKKRKDGALSFQYDFIVNDQLFTFAAHRFKNADVWEIIFFRHTARGSTLDATSDFTGKHAIEVFSAVKQLFTKWFKKHAPEEFKFSAKNTEFSRMAIYKKFANQITKITGYQRDEYYPDGELVFVFERPGSS